MPPCGAASARARGRYGRIERLQVTLGGNRCDDHLDLGAAGAQARGETGAAQAGDAALDRDDARLGCTEHLAAAAVETPGDDDRRPVTQLRRRRRRAPGGRRPARRGTPGRCPNRGRWTRRRTTRSGRHAARRRVPWRRRGCRAGDAVDAHRPVGPAGQRVAQRPLGARTPPTVTTTTASPSSSPCRRASSSAAWSAGEIPPKRSSPGARSPSSHLMQAPITCGGTPRRSRPRGSSS